MAEHAHTTPTPNTPPVAARRDLIAVCGAFLAIRGTAAARAQEPDTLAHPMPVFAGNADARLIALCAEHTVNVENYNRDGGRLEPEDDPLWEAYERTGDAITAAKPATLAGMVAKAKAAIAEAADLDDEQICCPGNEVRWAWQLIHDLLRLHGEEAV